MSRPPNAFYEQLAAGSFAATSATTGPWSDEAQHGGPPAALLAREIERHEPDQGQRLARVAVDILRPVPVAKLTVRAATVRPGRRVSLLEAVMECDGQEVARARGWRIARSPGTEAEPGSDRWRDREPPALPRAQPEPEFERWASGGYLSAIEWRFIGRFRHDAPSPTWTRPRIPLLEGERATPMCRALLVADSGSGVGSVLDPARFLFINVDLTVVLPRDPEGDWLLLEPDTAIGPDGTGLTATTLSDAAGRCGVAVQTLLVSAR
jgi:hypothetical protein